jgi:tight adherence protein C
MSILLLPIATFITFVTVSVMAWSVLKQLAVESAVTQRVKLLVGDSVTDRVRRRTGSGPLGRLVTAIGSHSVGADSSLAQRLSVAGYRSPNAAALFLGVRTLISVGPALLVLVPAVSSGNPLGRALLTAGFLWFEGHMLPNLWLKRRARARVAKVTVALPDALDLMVVCLEAGLGLNATIAKVGEERSSIADILGAEFAQVALELRNGRTREDALRGLGNRNGADDLKALVALIIQSDKLGASMAKTLRTHADLLRTKRRQRAEEAARKLPIKMLLPLATLILPPLFVVTTGPALLKLGDLSAMMQKG